MILVLLYVYIFYINKNLKLWQLSYVCIRKTLELYLIHLKRYRKI